MKPPMRPKGLQSRSVTHGSVHAPCVHVARMSASRDLQVSSDKHESSGIHTSSLVSHSYLIWVAGGTGQSKLESHRRKQRSSKQMHSPPLHVSAKSSETANPSQSASSVHGGATV